VPSEQSSESYPLKATVGFVPTVVTVVVTVVVVVTVPVTEGAAAVIVVAVAPAHEQALE